MRYLYILLQLSLMLAGPAFAKDGDEDDPCAKALIIGYFTPAPEEGAIFQTDKRIFMVFQVEESDKKVVTKVRAFALNKQNAFNPRGKLYDFDPKEAGEFFVIGQKDLRIKANGEIWYDRPQDLPRETQVLRPGLVISHPMMKGYAVVEEANGKDRAILRKLTAHNNYDTSVKTEEIPLVDGEFLKAEIVGFLRVPLQPGAVAIIRPIMK
jgi:hypothetical protein